MRPRTYNFDLPVQLSGLELEAIVDNVKAAGKWDEVSAHLQQALTDGAGLFGPGAMVTSAELDDLPDDLWVPIADQLNLSWTHGSAPP
jgi:hypothetical protein